MGATIKQIAEAAGVSRGTVDRVLHKRGSVSPEIEQRVLKLSQEMGFLTNKAGKILAARKRPLRIGVFLPSLGNRFFDAIIQGYRKAEEELKDFGVSLQFSQVEGFAAAEHMVAIRELAGQGCQALCVSTVDTPEMHTCINEVAQRGIAVAAVNTDLTDTQHLFYVGCDYLRGGRTVAGMLALIRPRPLHILVVTGSSTMRGHLQRIQGFLGVLDELGMERKILDVLECQDNEEISYEKTLAALRQYAGDITCLYVTAGGVEGVCRAVKKMGVERKFLICSHDEVPFTKRMMQEGIISFTVGQEPELQGYQAVHQIFEYFLRGCQQKPQSIYTQNIIRLQQDM